MKAKSRKPNPPPPAATDETPANSQFSEHLAKLAYALWEARGCPAASPDEDWYQAELSLAAVRTEPDQS